MSNAPPIPEKRLELLGDALAVVDEPKKPPGFDPYNQADAAPSAPVDGPKTLSPADMRRLSETIKDARTWTPPPKGGATPQLAALCSDLERVLTQLMLFAEPTAKKLPGLVGRISDAARHIENAIDCLSVPDGPQP